MSGGLKFVGRLFTFEEACRLYAKFIRYYCERAARKQRVRNRLDFDLSGHGDE